MSAKPSVVVSCSDDPPPPQVMLGPFIFFKHRAVLLPAQRRPLLTTSLKTELRGGWGFVLFDINIKLCFPFTPLGSPS